MRFWWVNQNPDLPPGSHGRVSDGVASKQRARLAAAQADPQRAEGRKIPGQLVEAVSVTEAEIIRSIRALRVVTRSDAFRQLNVDFDPLRQLQARRRDEGSQGAAADGGDGSHKHSKLSETKRTTDMNW
jgi:hypothetical protein